MNTRPNHLTVPQRRDAYLRGIELIYGGKPSQEQIDEIDNFFSLRPGRWERFKSWLCRNVKACKSWRLGRCYGMSRRKGIKLFVRNLFSL